MGQDSSAQISSYQYSPSTMHGAIDVHDVHHSRYYCDEGPVGTIALSLAAISLDIAYTHVC